MAKGDPAAEESSNFVVETGGDGGVVIDNCEGDIEVEAEDSNNTQIRNSNLQRASYKNSGGLIHSSTISGSGEIGLEIEHSNLDIYNLQIKPGHKSGFSAENSEFIMVDSDIEGDKYDIVIGRGVYADFYRVSADQFYDYARGERQEMKNRLIDQSISTTDADLKAEEIIERIEFAIRAVSAYFFFDGLLSRVV